MGHKKFWIIVILAALVALSLVAAKPASERPLDKFTAVSVCGEITGAPPKEVATGIRYTGQEQVCIDKASDPRMSGTTTLTIYGTLNPKANNAGKLWGLVETVNAGGKWQGLWKGKIDNQGRLFIHSKLVGMNGYYGLQAVYQTQRLTPEASYTSRGYIYKATKPVVVLPE
jgi:hypothetical protein